LAKGKKGYVLSHAFQVTVTNGANTNIVPFKMQIEVKSKADCKAGGLPMGMLTGVLAALLLCCLICFVLRQSNNNRGYQKVRPQEAEPLVAAAPAPRPDPNAPRPVAPIPVTKADAAHYVNGADPTETWNLRGAQRPRDHSQQYAKADAKDGQVGARSTHFKMFGLPLTFETPEGEIHTLFALQRPLGLNFDKRDPESREPIIITHEKDGHGMHLGIRKDWKLVGIRYLDITNMPFKEAEMKLIGHVNDLPLGVPMKWMRNAGVESDVVYAFEKPLGLTFMTKTPIKITEEKQGHGTDIGIKIGWELQEINYKDVRKMTTFDDVSTILREEIGRLPQKK